MYLLWSVIQTGEIKKEHMAKIKSFFSYGSTNQSISTSRLIDIFNAYNSHSKIFTTRLLGSLSYTKKIYFAQIWRLFAKTVQEISSSKHTGFVPEHDFYKYAQENFRYHLFSFTFNLCFTICLAEYSVNFSSFITK